MSTLTELVARVTALVPAQGGKPTSAQYTQAVRDAVTDFGRRCPRKLYGSLTIVAGTAAYTLPDGFQRLIELESLAADTYRNTDGFLVVFDTAMDTAEQYTISGTTITFYPTPAYSLTRNLWYAAGYPYAAGSDTFTGLAADAEEIVMLRAQANALRAAALVTAAGRGLNYQIGDVSIQRAVTQPHLQLAGELDSAYADACRTHIGFIGARAEYSGWEALR